jgi:hypothetical protein
MSQLERLGQPPSGIVGSVATGESDPEQSGETAGGRGRTIKKWTAVDIHNRFHKRDWRRVTFDTKGHSFEVHTIKTKSHTVQTRQLGPRNGLQSIERL